MCIIQQVFNIMQSNKKGISCRQTKGKSKPRQTEYQTTSANNYLTNWTAVSCTTNCSQTKMRLHLQILCDQQANVEKPVTLLQNTMSAAPSVDKVGQSLVRLQEELEWAAANCVDSQDELSSQLRLTTAQLSDQNKNSTLNLVIFTVTPETVIVNQLTKN